VLNRVYPRKLKLLANGTQSRMETVDPHREVENTDKLLPNLVNPRTESVLPKVK
jgi:hypothetical protein